jgi:hypothetical protein
MRAERHKPQLRIQLGNELRRRAERHERARNKPPIHAAVLADGFAEGAALVVDRECADLLDELQEIDCGVEQAGFELGFEVDFGVGRGRGEGVDDIGDVYERGDVDGELAEDGADDVGVEDIGLRALF